MCACVCAAHEPHKDPRAKADHGKARKKGKKERKKERKKEKEEGFRERERERERGVGEGLDGRSKLLKQGGQEGRAGPWFCSRAASKANGASSWSGFSTKSWTMGLPCASVSNMYSPENWTENAFSCWRICKGEIECTQNPFFICTLPLQMICLNCLINESLA